MAVQDDKAFYQMLDSIAETTGDKDAVQQNKQIKEAEFAEDSRPPTAEETTAIRKELEDSKHGERLPDRTKRISS